MIALKERSLPQSWSVDNERTTSARVWQSPTQRAVLLQNFCGAVVFVALVIAYILWA
jgi:hypothetical protein